MPTPPDDIGPFYRPRPPPLLQKCPVCRGTYRRHHLIVRGRVLSDDCKTPLPYTVIEVWQADQLGRYDTALDLRGYFHTDRNGYYEFTTVRPGNYRIRGYRPAHIHFYIPSQKGHRGVFTQMYFSGDPFLGRNDTCQKCNSHRRDLHVTMYTDCDRVGFCMDYVWFPIILARGSGVSTLETEVLQRRRQMTRVFMQQRRSSPVAWQDVLLPRRAASSLRIHNYMRSPRIAPRIEYDMGPYQQYYTRHRDRYNGPNNFWFSSREPSYDMYMYYK
ncbi:hypothetical protein FSP39_016391 [Pinctada imbricata]|uniref:Intradiol ring-cleavage dioxygenases domain-containing protein n=1 Tax=Pinctada imbricata TaxID=66713 RepID=A0AA88XSQ4_PINIB|nr:hypothetical protein FSP39_016391 [Pinctada imbricata]